MPLSAADRQLLDSMKQREFNLKKRQRAANRVHLEERRYRLVLVLLTALVFGAVLDAIVIAVESQFVSGRTLWRHAVVVLVVGTALGVLAGPGFLRLAPLQRLIRNKEVRLNQKYSGDLHAGRRWAQFYYRGEDISPYIGQLLYTIESEQRFDSIDEALAFAKKHSRENPAFRKHGLELFDSVARQIDLVVISSTDASGHPSSRFMRFVRSERPGVWYVTTAPDTPKVHELDAGRVAVTTVPTGNGATISSNRVLVRRAGKSFHDIADLYRTQVPRYLDGMTEEDQERELVYELVFESARVDSWVDHGLAVFDVDRAPRAEG